MGLFQEKMVDKKPLLLSNLPFEYDEKREKECSRLTLSWVLCVLVLSLFLVAFIQFFYPTTNGKFKLNEDLIINFSEEKPKTAIKAKPPMVTDFDHDQLHTNSEVADVIKDTEVDPWNINFVIDPKKLCATRNPPNSQQYLLNPEVKLLILIPSKTDHFQQRKAIRNTWGSIAKKPFGSIRLGFVLECASSETEESLIHEESSMYNDIIQISYSDDYSQFTAKNVLMLKWMAERCPHAEYFLKADDETFVNVGTVANILGNEPFVSQEKFIGGYVHEEEQSLNRNQEEKYYITEDYKSNIRPSYISGSAYVTTGQTAAELFKASKEVPIHLPLEDSFVTGFCGDYIDATLIHEPRFKYDDPPKPPTWQSLSNLATVRGLSPDIMQLIWTEIEESLSAMDFLLNQEAAINATVIFGRKRRVLDERK